MVVDSFVGEDGMVRFSSFFPFFLVINSAVLFLTQIFFGLYDGHGGRQVVEFVVRALHLVESCFCFCLSVRFFL